MNAFWQQREGQVIDGFPLRQYLGGGEDHALFLTEYAAETPGATPGVTQRKFVIKVMHADADSSESQLRRWRLGAELSHPNLMRLFERGSWHLDEIPLLYVVMEYADEDLSQVIPERPLTVAEAKEMLEPALGALAYLHSGGFVHGRLKPSNFMAIDGRLKISSDSVSQVGPGTLTPADDVWGLGMTLVEVLTQRLPASDAGETRDPVLPETIPPEFREIARNALRRDPRSRWTVAQIRERLNGRPAASAATAASAASGKRFSASAISTVLLAASLAIVAGTLLIRNRELAPIGVSQSQSVQNQRAPAATQPAPAAPATATPTPAIPTPHVESKPSPARPRNEEIVQQVMPEVFPRARSSIRGRVTASVRVEVDPAGDVSNAAIESGSSQYFSTAAVNAARRWKFAPAAGPRVWILKFEFTRTGTKVATVKSG